MPVSWEGEKVTKWRSWLDWGLWGPRGLDARCVISALVFPIPQEPRRRGPERPWLGEKTEREVARATKFPWVLEMGGFLPFPPLPSPHLSVTSPPPLPGFSAVPALKRDTFKPKGRSPLHGPLQAAWAPGTEAPLPPPPLCQMCLRGRGEQAWGPAGSGHLVVLSLLSQPVLCQLPGLPTQHFLWPTFQRQWLGLPVPIQHKS